MGRLNCLSVFDHFPKLSLKGIMQNPGNSTEKFDTENIGLLDYGINLHKNVEKKYLSNFFHGEMRRWLSQDCTYNVC